ncbi:hypothetical protein A2884_01240 [Candidatus Saccharibacteria bacterium RIFCSPHIGHO2_01_FULL_48_12]|nr:MAG: hypothetical protein A2884_01240 [Candidatus Saccharibacteria bacterium RIFCSPHIGHO2_01_FULL_48_12]OGL35881.1 MAG: hypothetical protein A3F38_01175 [Candidatus Saccharibacteria bacterium RIFCSPHIGHO2_12_FULL_48_21]
MTEFSPSEKTVERAIWEKVAAFSGEVSIEGFGVTKPNLLDEFEKNQIWLQWAETVWPTDGHTLLTEEEEAVLARMRKANPSDEDRIWVAAA